MAILLAPTGSFFGLVAELGPVDYRADRCDMREEGRGTHHAHRLPGRVGEASEVLAWEAALAAQRSVLDPFRVVESV